MMAVYDTYKEAVLANGSTDGVHENLRGGEFQFGFLEPGRWKICNPADYLETLESFLARGKRLVDGDRYIENDGEVVPITSDGDEKSVSEFAINTPRKGDENLFILQATADQWRHLKKKEAFDRIPNQATIDAMNSEAEKESYNSASEAFDAIDTTPRQVESLAKSEWNGEGLPPAGVDCEAMIDSSGSWIGCKVLFSSSRSVVVVKLHTGSEIALEPASSSFRKPETPAEREERERLEAAYYLYCKCGIQHETVSFEKFKDGNDCYPEVWLDIVNETGYRKQ